MPKTIKKADPKNYVLCQECSEEAGEEVWYPKRSLKQETGFFLNQDEGAFTCPEGHKVEVPES